MSYNLQHLLNLVHEHNSTFDAARVEAFIDVWKDSGGAESSHSQAFFVGLFALMGLSFAYEFEAAVRIPGDSNPKKMDVYRARHWVIEAKQGSFAHHATPGHGRR